MSGVDGVRLTGAPSLPSGAGQNPCIDDAEVIIDVPANIKNGHLDVSFRYEEGKNLKFKVRTPNGRYIDLSIDAKKDEVSGKMVGKASYQFATTITGFTIVVCETRRVPGESTLTFDVPIKAKDVGIVWMESDQ